MFYAERAMLDRWALWRERGFEDRSLGWPKATLLYRVAQYGIRTAPAHYGSEPTYDEISPVIDRYMQGLRGTTMHQCLEARHRRVIKGRPLGVVRERGRQRRYYERELADLLLGPGSVFRFRRLCEEGYSRLNHWLAIPATQDYT